MLPFFLMLNHRLKKFKKNPRKALWKLSFPIMIAMLVQALYNIVDTAFVGRLGAEAIAALTFAFPIMFILISINAGLGAGTNSRISRYVGEDKIKGAENAAMHGIILSIIFASLIFFSGSFFLRYLFSVAGAEGITLTYAVDYMGIILIGVFFMFPAFVFNSIFAGQGDTKTPMKIQVSSLILNMILDPIFIYVLGYGVKGAAIATSIAFFFGFLMYIYYLKKRSLLKIDFKEFKPSAFIMKQIMKVGFPASIMMLLMSFYMFVSNRLIASFGVKYIASAGLAFRLDSISVLPIVAMSIGLMTLVGMFYGARRYDLLKDIIKYSVKKSIMIVIVVGTFLFVFPSFFLKIFTSEKELLSIGSQFVRVLVFAYPFMAVSTLIARALQGMGKGIPGLVINLTRFILVSIPLAILAITLGYNHLSVIVSLVIGSMASSIVAVIWIRKKLNRLNT
ncbi:MATE family efflux transporter [Candidatus Woesearchaeota archaeon]|nr:MATE family efflux transporter [Candidatus Woesearchaeota archaeon]